MPERNPSNDQYSTWVGLIYIFNLIVGTGALTLPAVFSRAGWLLGLTVISILAFISFLTVTFVVETMASANAIITRNRIQQQKRITQLGDSGPSNSDSEDTPLVNPAANVLESDDIDCKYYTIDEKIEMGEMASIFFNRFGKTLFYACFAVYLYGDLSIYGAAVAKSLTDVACNYKPENFTCNDTIPDSELCWEGSTLDRFDAYRMFLTLFICLLGPFVFFNIQKTKYLQLLTSFMRWLAFITMIVYALNKIVTDGPQKNRTVVNIAGIPSLFGACVYSFMCHHSLPGLVAPISNKSKLNRYLALDYTAIALFYLLLALTGVFAFQYLDDLYTLDFGPQGSGDCSENHNFFMLSLEYFLALFPVFTLSTSFPIIAITLRNNLQSLFLNTSNVNERSNSYLCICFNKFVCPILAIWPPFLIAMATKDLKILVGITGSYAGAGIQYLIPTFLVYYARKKTGKIIGQRIRNKFQSPFIHNFWLVFVIVWAVTCMFLVSVNFLDVHLHSRQVSSILGRNSNFLY